MSLLEVTGLSQSFGDKELYHTVSFSLYPGEHMGVSGANGTGKSTLIELLAGRILPDEGRITWLSGIRIGYLDQHAQAEGALTMRDYLMQAFARLSQLEREMLAAYEAYAVSGEEAELRKAAAMQAALEAGDFYTAETRMEKVARGLGLYALGLERPMEELSGGQRAKVILAKLLLEEPDVLLLDEPTNFLDKEHVDWLAELLSCFRGAFLVVSHDSAFLARISSCVLDIEGQELRKYYGTYEEYLRQKEERREDRLRRYEAQTREIARTKAYIRKNLAGVNTRIAQGRRKQLARMERITPPSALGRPIFRIDYVPCVTREALRVEKLRVGYTFALLPELNFSVSLGERLAVTGFNGIGKSTLLKTLAGRIPALSGSFTFGPAVRLGYFEQELHWEDAARTPLQIIHDAYPFLTKKEIRSRLAGYGLKGDSVFQPVATLSGGEQSKVKLCRILLSPCNFLILDEPTNHLDAATRAALRDALTHFEGSVLLVSHEKEFYAHLADREWTIGEGGM